MRPLDGVHILDLTRLLPGAYATLLLADLGAEVTKIEDPIGGDPVRQMPPVVDGDGVYFRVLNRNKKSVTLDLRKPESARVLDALIARADVVVESFRPKTSRRLGVDAATLRRRHPRLVYASVTGFGQTGPYADRPAHDINYEALSGLLGLSAADGRTPQTPRTLVGDIGAAMQAGVGIVAALYQRERTGRGAAVDVAIHEAALSWLLFPAARELTGAGMAGDALPIYGDHACYNVYATADGRHVALGALEFKFWKGFCEQVRRPELIPFHDVGGEPQARALEEIRRLMRERTRDEWVRVFAALEVCLTPVNTVAEALADPHLTARAAVRREGRTTYIPTPILVAEQVDESGWQAARGVPIEPAPALGQHTDDVLEAAGIETSRRRELRAAGVI